MNSIKIIKSEFQSCSIECLNDLINLYSNDKRKGVQSIIKSAKKLQQYYQEEVLRLKKISQYEAYFYEQGKKYIAGIDEVGRGPLAGPVVSSVVILPKDILLLEINDSKKISENKRKKLFDKIIQKALEVQVGIEDNYIIDEINILQATIKSMEKAINKLKKQPDQIIIDSLNLPNVKIPQLNMVKADEKSVSVAAASIIAKVIRDGIMDKYHKLYPQYSFDKNKGYGTKTHIEAIKKYGTCPIHRKTFLKNLCL